MRSRTSTSLRQFLGTSYEDGKEADLVQYEIRHLTGSQDCLVPIGDPITEDLVNAIRGLEATKIFAIQHNAPVSSSDHSGDSITQRQPTLPSLSAILEWPQDIAFPQQNYISHFLSENAKQTLMSKLDVRGRHRLQELQRKSWPLYDPNSKVAFCDPKCTKHLNVTPRSLMALTNLHYLENKDFNDLEGFLLGLEIPSIPASRTSCGLNEFVDKALTSARYAGGTRCQSHDTIANFVAELAWKAGLRNVSTQARDIPRQSPGTDQHGDIYFKRGLAPGDNRASFVADVTLGHPFSGASSYEADKLRKLEMEKNRKYCNYHEQNIQFFPLACTSFGNIGPDFARLLYRLAVIQSSPPQHPPFPNSFSSSNSRSDLELEDDEKDVWYNGPSKGVRYSWLVKDVIHQIALATLLRLRGRDEVASLQDGVDG